MIIRVLSICVLGLFFQSCSLRNTYEPTVVSFGVRAAAVSEVQFERAARYNKACLTYRGGDGLQRTEWQEIVKTGNSLSVNFSIPNLLGGYPYTFTVFAIDTNKLKSDSSTLNSSCPTELPIAPGWARLGFMRKKIPQKVDGTLDLEIPFDFKHCPPNYVQVEGNIDLETSEFCVAKYEMKDVNGKATSQASGTPWVEISRDDSIVRCQALGERYDLISNAQWQALAREIETAQSPEGDYLNWSNNSTSGINYMNHGHSDNLPANALAATTDNSPCSGTGNADCADNTNADFTQKRTHTLKSGEIIWDVAGNVWEWVKDDISVAGNEQSGYVSTNDWTPDTKLKFGPKGNYSHKTSPEYGGLGYVDFSNTTMAVVRGGDFNFADFKTGLFTADLDATSTDPYNTVGFRCVFLP